MTTSRKVTKRRNFDPVSAMMIAQGTGADRVLLGKKGFRALTDKKTYTGTGRGRNPEDIEFLNDMAPVPSLGHIEFTPDGIEWFMRGGYVYQAFTATPVFGDGYRQGTPVETVQDYAVVNPAKYERCIKAVQRQGGANGYAVCTAAGLRNPSYHQQTISELQAGNARLRSTLTRPEVYKGEHAFTRKYIRQNDQQIKRLKREYAKESVRGRRGNPESTSNAVYEEFHGAPPSEILEVRETEHVHGHLAGIGDLVSIVVMLTGGRNAGSKIELNAPDPGTSRDADIVRVATNEAKNQLYFVGGDQSIDVSKVGFRDSFNIVHDGETFEATELKDKMMIGEICKLTYRTQKKFDGFEDVDYFHKVGEDTRVRPFLAYDTINEKMSVLGGEYTVHSKGIVN